MSWVETSDDPRDASALSGTPSTGQSASKQASFPWDGPPSMAATGLEPNVGGTIASPLTQQKNAGSGGVTSELEEWLEDRVSLVDDEGLRAMGISAQAHGFLWVALAPPGPQFRGRLGLFIEESVESELERLGALSPGIHASTGLDASLSDQLYRARLLEKRGIALTVPSLEGICNLGRVLDAEDGAVLRWWIAAAADRPVRVVVSRKNSSLRVYPSPVLFESLFEVAPFPPSPHPPCVQMAEAREAMELSDLPPEVESVEEEEEQARTSVLGTSLGSVGESESMLEELWDSADVDLSDLDRALGLSAAPEARETVIGTTPAEDAGDPAVEGRFQESIAVQFVEPVVEQERAQELEEMEESSPLPAIAAADIPDLELRRAEMIASESEPSSSSEARTDCAATSVAAANEGLGQSEAETPIMPPLSADAARLAVGTAKPPEVRDSVEAALTDPASPTVGAPVSEEEREDAVESSADTPGELEDREGSAAAEGRAVPSESASSRETAPGDIDAEEFLRTLVQDSVAAPAVVEPGSDLASRARAEAFPEDEPERSVAQARSPGESERADPDGPSAASRVCESEHDGADALTGALLTSHDPSPLPTKKIKPFLRLATEEDGPPAASAQAAPGPAPEEPQRDAASGEGLDPEDPFNKLAAREWRKWAKNLTQARGPKPLSVVERMFVTDYTRLREAARRGIADRAAGEVLDEWRESFQKSYSEAFEALRVRGKRPTMVLDLPDVGQRLARLQGARRLQLLMIDGMRFDLGLVIQERMKAQAEAALTERLLLWSALPTTTSVQLELLGRGPEGLKEPLPSEDEPPALVARGQAAKTARRIRTGHLEVYKIDVIEDALRQTGTPVLSRFGQIAEATSEAICAHLEKQAPRTLVVVFGDHGFALDPERAGTTAEVRQGGASPEEVLVPAFAWLTGAVH